MTLDVGQRVNIALDVKSLVIAKKAADGNMITTPLKAALLEIIKENQIDVIFVDPFTETFEGDENSSTEAKWATVRWR